MEISESTKQRVSSLLSHVLKEHQNTKYGVQDALVRVGWHELINRYLLLILVPGEKEQILTTNQDNNHNSLRNVQREALIDLAFAAVEQYHAKFEFMGDAPKPLPKDGWRPKKPERTRW